MKRIAIIIDDGHGQNTPGKSSPIFTKKTKVGNKIIPVGGRFRENTFNMAVADWLEKLALDYSFPVNQVAPEHEDISLAERVIRQKEIYNKFVRYDFTPVSISIHANAFKPCSKFEFNSANGIETFYKPSDFKSQKLAALIQEKTIRVRNQRNRRVVGANFKLLRMWKGIAVLFESGFMTNKEELTYLATIEYQREIAHAILQAVIQYQGGIYIRGRATNERHI